MDRRRPHHTCRRSRIKSTQNDPIGEKKAKAKKPTTTRSIISMNDNDTPTHTNTNNILSPDDIYDTQQEQQEK